MPQHTGSTILCDDGFITNVRTEDRCELEVVEETNNLVTNPGGTITIEAIYRGGTGVHYANRWNIYMYDRDDDHADGSARTHGQRSTNPPIPGLPVISGLSPAKPKEGRPDLTDDEWDAFQRNGTQPTRDVHIAGPGRDDTYWILKFRVTSHPSDDPNVAANIRVHEEITAFMGHIEMYQA